MRMFLPFFMLIFLAPLSAQISINSSSFIYSQDFDGLVNSGTGNAWSNNSTLSGWYATQITYNAGTGSSNTGAMYSFGATGDSERALGSVCSNGTGTVFYGVRFLNNTSSTISQMTIEFSGEQWRNGGNTIPQDLTFAYQIGALSLTSGAWTTVPELTFTSPVATATAAALDGNLPANRELLQHTLQVNIAAGQEIWFRWQDLNDAGNDHGLSVDDFMINNFILPVRFSEVHSQRKNEKVLLDFVTESEVNNDFFTIERSEDGQNFYELGKVNGSGNSFVKVHYSYVDESPGKGVLYYRIKQSDFDGKFEYSSVVKVSPVSELVNIIYKNTGKNILIETELESYSVEIFQMSGTRVWFGSSLKGVTNVAIDNLPSGLYVVRVLFSDRVVSQQFYF